MTTATKTYTLSYSTLTPRDGGTFDQSGGTEFGTETQSEAGQFESIEDALYTFKDYLAEQSEGAIVKDVTDAEGFQGWGTVLRVSHEEYGDTLYSVTVE